MPDERREGETIVPGGRRLEDQELARAEATLQIAREWLSISHYARKYGVSRHTVYKWLDEGLIDEFRVGWLRRVKDSPPRAA